ncbi:hypothetical protein BKA93DRAFT_830085 [Sparassis latifolia]
MATHPQPSGPSSLSRLSRLGIAFGLKPGPSTAVPHINPSPTEDWYIPYNGPYEKPHSLSAPHDRDSWGNLVSGWLVDEDDDKRGDRISRPIRARAVSSASRLSVASGDLETTRRSLSTRRAAGASQVGGVGEAPMPMRPSQDHPRPPEVNRNSFANILGFRHTSKRGLSLHQPASAEDLRNASSSRVHRYGEAEGNGPLPRPHPYSYASGLPTDASSSASAAKARPSPTSKFSITLLEPMIRKSSGPAMPNYLKPAHRPPGRSLKVSTSTPNLRRQRGSPSPFSVALPKGKQRWLSAETWCDAILLPRPRFTMRVTDTGANVASSGRIVSPPGSPIWPPGTGPGEQVESPTEAVSVYERGVQESTQRQRRDVRKSQSASQLVFVRPPSPEIVEAPRPVVPLPPGPLVASSSRPPRPKSFAWDDLAIPSPVPSLTKVLEDGRQLEVERKEWQSLATRSFQNKRARSVSRARAKSLTSSRVRLRDTPTTLDLLAERTLLGGQTRPPTVHIRVQQSLPSDENATGFGISTFSSATHTQTQSHSHSHSHSNLHSHSRAARSHAHSNSMGTSASHPASDDSFMWVAPGAPSGGHKRTQSLGKSALRIVRNTANSAANFCGFSPGDPREPGIASPVYENGCLEGALRSEGTRVIRLRDQIRMEERNGEGEGVVLITPAPASNVGLRTDAAGPSRMNGMSPTPSGSGEGVGIAISTPPHSDDHHERLRIPAHPYAQVGNYVYRQPIVVDKTAASVPSVSQADTAAVEDGLNRHRQPVHPYSPYAKGLHPYAVSGASNARQHPPAASNTSMFAEISTGHIREILPDEIKYSPLTPTGPSPPPMPSPQDNQEANASERSEHSHPYGPQSRRTSEWGFADALTHTLGRAKSGDNDEMDGLTPPSMSVAQILVSGPQQEEPPPVPSVPIPKQTSSSSRSRIDISREPTHLSNHTVSSSMGSINPAMFRRTHSAHSSAFLHGNSSRSSPGMISHDSSPPLSPRPLNAPDDLERFRDLFYHPPDRSRTPSDDGIARPVPSRQASGTIPIDFGSERTVSGLTTLARQLSEDLEELRDLARDSYESGEATSPMWGRRFGGLHGERPDDLRENPNVVLSQSPSGSNSSPETSSRLGLPLDRSLSLMGPTINVPEDVASSRASSVLESPLQEEEEAEESLRLGTVEVLSTPPPFETTHRFSTRLSLIGYARGGRDEPQTVSLRPSRISSQPSSLGAPPSSDAARSSFMTADTNVSRMSGLSDFPAPPTDVTPENMSVLNTYFEERPQSQSDKPFNTSLLSRPPPTLVRESSRGTFGRQNDAGEAL